MSAKTRSKAEAQGEGEMGFLSINLHIGSIDLRLCFDRSFDLDLDRVRWSG